MKLTSKSKRDKYGFIKAIGIELEGKWDDSPRIHDEGSFYGDGSVEFECHCDNYHEHDSDCQNEDGDYTCDYGDRGCYCEDTIGEIGSKPMTSFQEAYEFMNKWYPDETNRSCGNHFHISFNSHLSYMQLMTKRFYDYFLERCERWGKYHRINEDSSFWYRLAGKNHYCERKFQPHLQCHTHDKTEYRYCHLNYCYPLYNTIECRLFPAFKKKELALSSLELFVDICNSWLKRKTRNRVINTTVIDNDSIERKIEEILCVS